MDIVQDTLDKGADIDTVSEDISAHLSTCPECKVFAANLVDFGTALKSTVASTLSDLGPPNLAIPEFDREAPTGTPSNSTSTAPDSASPSRRIGVLIKVAAITLFVGLSTISAVFGVRGYTRQRHIKEQVTMFVDELMNTSVFTELTESGAVTDIFITTDIVSEFIVELPDSSIF